jgi:hypothetical protein
MRNDWLGLRPLRPLTAEEIEKIQEQRQDILIDYAVGFCVVGILCYHAWINYWDGISWQIPYILPIPIIFIVVGFFILYRAGERLKDDLVDGVIYELLLNSFKIGSFQWGSGRFYILEANQNNNKFRRHCYIASKKRIFRGIKSTGPGDVLHVTKNLSFIANK